MLQTEGGRRVTAVSADCRHNRAMGRPNKSELVRGRLWGEVRAVVGEYSGANGKCVRALGVHLDNSEAVDLGFRTAWCGRRTAWLPSGGEREPRASSSWCGGRSPRPLLAPSPARCGFY